MAPIASRFDFVPLQAQSQGPVPRIDIVAIKIRRSLIRGEQKIQIAIPVEVAVCEPARDFRRREPSTHLRGDVAKSSLAIVQEQVRRLRVAMISGDLAHRLIDVSVHRYQIQVAIQIDIKEGAAEAEAFARRLSDAGLRRRRLYIRRRVAGRYSAIISLSKLVIAMPGVPELSKSAASTPMPARALPSSLNATPARNRDVFEGSVAQIAVQFVRLRVVGDQEVRPAVAIVVQQGHAQRFRRAVEDSALRGHIFKDAVSAIAKQPAGSTMVASGVQYDLLLPSTLQKTSCSGDHLHVIADEKIQQAVAVVIEPDCGRAEGASSAQPGLLRDVDESARARVLKEAVLSDRGHQDIGKAVVVVVADCDSHAIHFDGQAGALRHVGECAVAVVAIEAHACDRCRLWPGQSVPLTSRISSQPSPS